MAKDKKMAIFNYWFERDGHYMFGVNGYDKALQAWKERGIEGLPNY